MNVFRLQERVTGIDAADVLVQALLFGIGLAGTRLNWKLREPKSPPQIGRCSVTLSLPADDCPWWLRLNLHALLSFQETARELSRQIFLKQPSPAQIRLARDQAKMRRNWMLQTPEGLMTLAKARRRPQNVDFLVTLPHRYWFQQTESAFGSDRLLLLRGGKDYQRLIKHREVPPFLLEMESGGNAWPRITFHGWMRDDALLRTIRELTAESTVRLGWLVPAGIGKQQPDDGRGGHAGGGGRTALQPTS